MVFLEHVAKDFKVFRFEDAGIFFDFIEVGIDAPLTYLVADNRHIIFVYKVTVVGFGFRGLCIDSAFEACTPMLNARLRCAVVIVLGDDWPACGGGVDTSWIFCFQ